MPEYISSRPNAVWHMDGHHKLSPWGFIVHASIDGCDSIVGSRLVILSRGGPNSLVRSQITGMNVTGNNLPGTAVDLSNQLKCVVGHHGSWEIEEART